MAFCDAPGDGTEIRVQPERRTPRGKLGEVAQKVLGSVSLAKVKDDLPVRPTASTSAITRTWSSRRGRPRQAGHALADRSPGGSARRHPGVPARRDRVDHRRLRRAHGQVPRGGADEQEPDHQDWAVSRAPLPEASLRAHKEDECVKVVLKP